MELELVETGATEVWLVDWAAAEVWAAAVEAAAVEERVHLRCPFIWRSKSTEAKALLVGTETTDEELLAEAELLSTITALLRATELLARTAELL